MNLELERSDLTAEPAERTLNMGRVIGAFNIKLSAKTIHLNTGNKFNYNCETYEIMNREAIDSPDNYVKFNCLRKASAQPDQSKKTVNKSKESAEVLNIQRILYVVN